MDEIEGIAWKRDDIRAARHTSFLCGAQGADVKEDVLRTDILETGGAKKKSKQRPTKQSTKLALQVLANQLRG